MIGVAENDREIKKLLAMDNANTTILIEVVKILSVIDLRSKYS